MATVKLEAFLPDVLIHVLECPEPVLLQALRNAVGEFCTETLIWNELTDEETVSSWPYDVSVGGDSRLVRIVEVFVDDEPVDPLPADQGGSLTWQTDQGQVEYYTTEGKDQLWLIKQPVSDVSLRLRLAYKPSPTATSVPSSLLDDWSEEISAGALARVMAIPNRPWSNPQLALFYGNVFDSGVRDAKAEVDRSFIRGARHVTALEL